MSEDICPKCGVKARSISYHRSVDQKGNARERKEYIHYGSSHTVRINSPESIEK